MCNWCAYGAADMMGIKGIKATENFRTIRIRCSGSISPEVLSEILFQNKADGIVVAGCPPDNCHHLWGNYVTDKRIKLMQDTLSEFGIDSSRLRWEYIGVPQWDLMAKVLNFMDKGLREKN
jgi:heterodisulfide reductase subunit A